MPDDKEAVKKLHLNISQNSRENTCVRASYLVMQQVCRPKKTLPHCVLLWVLSIFSEELFYGHMWREASGVITLSETADCQRTCLVHVWSTQNTHIKLSIFINFGNFLKFGKDLFSQDLRGSHFPDFFKTTVYVSKVSEKKNYCRVPFWKAESQRDSIKGSFSGIFRN